MVTASGDVYTFGANQEGELCRKEGRGEIFVPPGLIDAPRRGMFKDACSSEVGHGVLRAACAEQTIIAAHLHSV